MIGLIILRRYEESDLVRKDMSYMIMLRDLFSMRVLILIGHIMSLLLVMRIGGS